MAKQPLATRKRVLKHRNMHHAIERGIANAEKRGYTKPYDIETCIIIEIERTVRTSNIDIKDTHKLSKAIDDGYLVSLAQL
jgi:hypothetical protein